MTTAIGGGAVAKKKASESEGQPKRYGTLIRVSDTFADALKKAASFEKISMAEFADLVLLPVTENRYRDAVIKEAAVIKKLYEDMIELGGPDMDQETKPGPGKGR